MSQPHVIVVILNTNHREDTLACLASLAQTRYTAYETLVLDNASQDGSVAAIRSQFPQVEVLQLTENGGYAGNNNVGIRAALDRQADWVLVLNEDTILDPACIGELVQVGETDPRIGVVGPMVYHFTEPNVIQSAGGSFDRFWRTAHLGQNQPDTGQYTQPHDVGWISGCAIMVRRQVIEQIGALDARFFYYFEETEWCLRASEAGWRIVHAPQAKIWHKGVQRDYRPSPSVTYYSTRNRLLMLAKHRAPLTVWLVIGGEILRPLISWTVKPRWRGMREHRNALWLGLRDFARRRWGPLGARLTPTSGASKRQSR